MNKTSMPKGHPVVSQEIKGQIIKRIREDGILVSQIANEHGIKLRVIYQWISRGVTAPPSIFGKDRNLRQDIFNTHTLNISLYA